MYNEDDLLTISALQHLIFCERQCALIHIEQAWAENLFTAEGRIMHERVHADRHKPYKPRYHVDSGMTFALSAQVSPYIGSIREAAYDVLVNKPKSSHSRIFYLNKRN